MELSKAPMFTPGQTWHLASQRRFLMTRKHFGGYPSILADAHAETFHRGRFANKRQPWAHVALKVCRYFYSEAIPLRCGRLSVYCKKIHQNLVNLFFLSRITNLLEQLQGGVECRITAGGCQQ
jgi:hypothetical protein